MSLERGCDGSADYGGLPPLPCRSRPFAREVYLGRDIPCARMSSSLLLICHVGGRGGGVWVQPRRPADGLARSPAGKGRTRAGTLRPAAAPHGTVAARWPVATLDRPAPTTSLAGCRRRPSGCASRVVVVTHRISSGLLVVFVVVVGPGGVLVVEGAGFEAAVQDADESVAELA
jgi:hypothetical protein